MLINSLSKLLGAASAIALALAGSAMACGYHGPLGDGFSAMHARSIDVAIALREAIDAGQLPEHVAARRVDLVGFHRARNRLARLRDALQRQADDAAPPTFSLLLIEPALWSRFSAYAGRIALELESSTPAEGEATVITGEAVIAAVLSGSLSGRDALDRGLMVVDAPAEERARLAILLAKALTALQPPS